MDERDENNKLMMMKTKSVYIIFAILFAGISSFGQNEVKNDYNPIQVEGKPWVPSKPDTKWQWFETRIVKNIHDFTPTNGDFNKYGSSKEYKIEATGFYRVEKIGERWWIVDPEGYLNIQVFINSLGLGRSERNEKAFDSKFKTEESWIKITSDSLQTFGFTGAGAWSNNQQIKKNNDSNGADLSYTPILNFMSSYGKQRGGTYQLPGNVGYPNQCIFVFDPEFETFCDEHAKQLEDLKDDKNIFGFFSDNEMPLGLKNLEGYLTLKNTKDPGRLAAEKWLKNRNKRKAQITDADRADFAGYVADRYYSIVSKAIKRYAPNHLFIGSRVHGGAKMVPQIVEAAGKYCDVLSFNYYGVWTPKSDLMKMWIEKSNRPFIITEFYTKAMDAGLANTTGAGYTVRTQTDKGYAYQDFCLALLESKGCVGWHYFKYQDNDPTAKGVDPSNIDSNKGIVNNDYVYYQNLMISIKELNINRYKLVKYFDNKQKTN